MNHLSNTPLPALRAALQAASLQACIIPSTDPYISEYTPDHWKTRQWLSGFTGSAGTLVVTLHKAGLWTDSRYFLQAEEQLQGSAITLYKEGLPDTPSPEQWLAAELQAGDAIGLEGAVCSAADVLQKIDFFHPYDLRIDPHFAPYNALWPNRPAQPTAPAFVLPDPFTGESVRSKIDRLLKALEQQRCTATMLASLDAIAWLLNLRGNDVPYNPVFLSYLFVSQKETVLFISPEKITAEVNAHLQAAGIACAGYETLPDFLQKSKAQPILIASSKINYDLYCTLSQHSPLTLTDLHPVDEMKAIKNETEIAGIRRAMQRDGVALVRFLRWIEIQMEENQPVTELDVSDRLRAFRSQEDLFFEESFETIAAYGPHGAIVHYAPTEASAAALRPEGLLLLDSGAQYLDGTTDITRTIALGPVTAAMRHDFTRLLKGNIQLSTAVFPRGTVGMQLDILARQPLWEEHENYLHGTGHGVGHFLNVHEGPQSIRMNYNPTPLAPGMITSNEPGLYRAGQYGIRIENLLLTVPAATSDWGEFYQFETLTLCPIDARLIDYSLLTPKELLWLNNYHLMVYNTLVPFLSPDEAAWLKEKTGAGKL